MESQGQQHSFIVTLFNWFIKWNKINRNKIMMMKQERVQYSQNAYMDGFGFATE